MIYPKLFYFAASQIIYDVFGNRIGGADLVYKVDPSNKTITCMPIKYEILYPEIKKNGIYTTLII